MQFVSFREGTPPKFNIDPENDGWKTTFLWDGIFSGAMLNFQGGYPEHPGRTMIHIAGNFHLLRIGILNAPERGGDGGKRWVPENQFLNG